MPSSDKNVIFLHIPKTAGQSVHGVLCGFFNQDKVCPARSNRQLKNMSLADMKKYQLFSGHFDWQALDFVKEPKYVFTILRNPEERILSFYFYLRSKAKKLEPRQLRLGENRGMRMALELSPDEYFCSKSIGVRNFIDRHYDNFFTYYFAGRSFDGRQKFATKPRGRSDSNAEDILLELATNNMRELSAVYDISEVHQVSTDISEFLGIEAAKSELYVNKGDGRTLDERYDELSKLGATARTFERIKQFTELDNLLYKTVQSAKFRVGV